TKHIAIRHHFIRDAYEKKLIQVLKIHINDNVAYEKKLSSLYEVFSVKKHFNHQCCISRSSLGFRESLGRVLDGTEALLLPKLFILWLATVSTNSAELVPLGKVSTAIETLKKNTAKEKTDRNAKFHEIIDFLTRSSIHHALTGKYFLGKVTSLFASMLVQPTEDEGAPSERPSEAQPTPSHIHTSEVPVEPQTGPSPRPSPSTTMPDSIPESSGGNLGGSVFKQGRKFAKGESSVQRDPLFDKIPKDTVDHMETENAQDEGRIREIVDEDKEIDEIRLSTEDVLSTDKEVVSTDKEKVSTDRPIVSTDGSKISTDRQIEGTDEQIEGTEEHNEGTEEHIEGTEEQIEGTDEQIEGTEEHNEGTEEHIEGTEEQIESTDGQRKGTEDHTEEEIAAQPTQTHTSTVFGDDETIAKVLLNMSQAK
ncbi:hypothetical protein Tco_1451874, partial [Tanacetum coccineum]